MERINFKKRTKETLALVLSILLVAGTFSVPVKSAGTVTKTIPFNSVEEGDVFVPGDAIAFTDGINYGKVILYYSEMAYNVEGGYLYPGPDDNSHEDSYREGGNVLYYYSSNYTLPNKDNSLIHSVDRNYPVFEDGYDIIFRFKSLNYMGRGEAGNPVYKLILTPHFGFRTRFCDTSGEVLQRSGGEVYNERIPGDLDEGTGKLNWRETEPVSLVVNDLSDSVYGDVIGWSTNQNDATASSLSGVFIKAGDRVTFAKVGETAKAASNSTLKMYPVFDKASAEAEISMSGYTLTSDGEVPSYVEGASLSKDSEDTRTYEILYYPASDGEQVIGATGSSSLPDEPGEYIAVATADATDTVINGDGEITSRGLVATEAVSPSFEVLAQATGTLKARELTYTGEAQELVEVDEEAVGGHFEYGEEEGGPFTTTVPTATEVGAYTVFYKVVGDEGYDDSGVESLVVSIEESGAKLLVTPAAKTGLFYTGSEQELLDNKGKAENGTLVYGFTENGNYSDSVPTGKDPKEYTVWYKVIGDNNYKGLEPKSLKVRIEKGTPKLATKPAPNSLTENGKAQELVSAGKAENGTVLYSTKKDGSYSTEIPTGTSAGEYSVWYKVNGDTNYKDLDPAEIKVTISKKSEEKKEEEKKEETKTLKDGSVSISVSSTIYGGDSPTPVVSSSTNDITKASIFYKPSGAPDSALTGTIPTEVGTYVAVVSLPANDTYKACSATCGFSISYMQVPAGAYSIQGTQGVGGWYTSQVTLMPGTGYQISVRNRQNFTNQAISLSETDAGSSFFIRKESTGEQSAAIQITTLKIDAVKPQIHDMESGGIYFTDEKGVLKGTASDKNLDKVLVDGNEVKTVSDGQGHVTFDLPSGKRKQNVKITVVDKAGNESAMEVITAPEWMKTGIIREGDLFLEGDTEFKTPVGDATWTKDGDDTTYMPGISFFADEGDATFHKH